MLALKKNKLTTLQEALRSAVMQLQQHKIETASLDARLLLEHVTGYSREQLLMHIEDALSAPLQERYRQLVGWRGQRRPMAQLLGKRAFWDSEFIVTSDTLDPRPDSETLIEAVISRFPDRQARLSVLDLGTGTGCLLLTLLKEYPHMAGTGLDISEAALSVAKENALALGLQARAKFVRSDWFEQAQGPYDLIISNPPYIASDDIAGLAPEVALFEPKLALDGGADGLDAYRAIISRMAGFMADGAVVVFEIGLGQQHGVETLAKEAGLRCVAAPKDLGGLVRCLLITK